MISTEELRRIENLAKEYIKPTHPREGHQTIALWDELNKLVMGNLNGLLKAARKGVNVSRT